MTIDILLPFWGDPAYLYQAVASVRAQTVPDWRLIVVDDAYPDESVPEYFSALDDSRIAYHRNETNKGITENYRRCLELATSDWVVFLGCDDVMLPNYLETVVGAIEAFPSAVVVQPGVTVIDERSKPSTTLVDAVKQRVLRPRVEKATALSGEKTAASLLTGNWLYWPSLAFSRTAVLDVGFREGFPMVQDLALVMDMLYSGGTLVLDPTVCFAYRRHAASASSAGAFDGSRFEGERRYFEIAAQQASALGWRRAARAARLRLTSRAYAVTLLPGALRQRSWTAARQLAGYAFSSAG